MPDNRPTPRQRVLDTHARDAGRNLSEFPDGESYRMLQQAKSRVGSKAMTGSGLVDSWDSPATGTTAGETAQYRAKMEQSYNAGKTAKAKAAGQPTGYDAAMRGVVKPQPERVMSMIRNRNKKK